MDKALGFGTKDCRLESCQDHLTPVSFGPDGHLFEASNAAQGTEPQARNHGQPSSGPMGPRVSWRRGYGGGEDVCEKRGRARGEKKEGEGERGRQESAIKLTE